MRVLVLHAHPVAESFNGVLFREICARLSAKGHEVDACDLYAEGFDPVLSRDERLAYHDISANAVPVRAHVDRVMEAEALVICHPVWNFGYPAMLKGYFDRVFLPGVSFRLEDGRVRPNLQHIRKMAVVTTYGAARWRAIVMGDPPRRLAKRMLRSIIKPGAQFTYHALYDMNRATDDDRRRFLSRTGELMDRF